MNQPNINYNDLRIRTPQEHNAITHNWSFRLGTLPAGLSYAEFDLGAISSDGVALDEKCLNVSIPNTNISTVEGNVRGVHFHQIQTRAGTQLQTSLTFYEPHSYNIYRFFEKWKSLTVRRSTGAQYPMIKVNNALIDLYTTDRQHKVMSYHLYDTYCESAHISDPQGAANLQQVAVVLKSSNYGIIAYVDGQPVVGDDHEALLGTDSAWKTATGTNVEG